MGLCDDEILRALLLHIRGIRESELLPEEDCDFRNPANAVRTLRRIVLFEDSIAIRPLHRVYSEVVGPINDSFVGISKYFVILFDE